MTDKILSAIGLAHRARKTVLGSDNVIKLVRAHKALLVILACDTSQNSQKKILSACEFHGAEVIEHGTMEALSNAIGQKKLISSVAITDENFKKLIKKQYSGQTEND